MERVELLMKESGVGPQSRDVVGPARRAAEDAEAKGKGNEGVFCGAAIELYDGTIVTGKNSPLLHAASSLVLNAVKAMAGIPDEIHLLSPNVIDSVAKLKGDILNSGSVSLDLEEALIALSICAAANPTAGHCLEKLKELRGCEVHLTHIPTPGDEAGLRKLGVNLTSEPQFATRRLFQT